MVKNYAACSLYSISDTNRDAILLNIGSLSPNLSAIYLTSIYLNLNMFLKSALKCCNVVVNLKHLLFMHNTIGIFSFRIKYRCRSNANWPIFPWLINAKWFTSLDKQVGGWTRQDRQTSRYLFSNERSVF